MRYKVLVENSGENKIPEGKKIPARKNWFAEWHSACHVPSSTAHEWWQQFADATGLTITPSKANKGQQQAFAQWHLDQIEQKKKDDEMKRQEDQEKAKEAALSNATKEYERAKKIYENACEVAKAAGVVNIFWLQT